MRGLIALGAIVLASVHPPSGSEALGTLRFVRRSLALSQKANAQSREPTRSAVHWLRAASSARTRTLKWLAFHDAVRWLSLPASSCPRASGPHPTRLVATCHRILSPFGMWLLGASRRAKVHPLAPSGPFRCR